MRFNLIFAACALALVGCSDAKVQETYYEKELVFPADADSITKVEMASRLVPSKRQLDWQALEMTAFLHFGVNTFTDREWGNGQEDPSIFNPVDLDAEQWVKTLKDAGFKMVILTAKHHDGFCLWPTATTDHSVKASPWRDGNGDVVGELKNACDKYGMKLGLYLSPWDRNAACYGDSPKYNDMFVAQLTELLSNYGKVDEVWFDGACGEGPNGKKQEYDWQRYKEVIQELQPDAVVAIMGDDVRWVGNENGLGRETEWSATAITPGILSHADESNERLGLRAKSPDLGGRPILAKADRLYWWPSEVDVSIRPGWFYHDSEQPKSLRDLASIYLNSVGRNSVLLLNVPPDRRGLIADADVARLNELNAWIKANTDVDLAYTSDNDNVSYTSEPVKANCVTLAEDISKGQRVEEFTVEGRVGEEWIPLVSGTTIGYKRILMFPDTEIDAVRVRVDSHRGAQPNLLPVKLHYVKLPEAVMSDRDIIAPKTDWSIVSSPASDASKAIDGNPASFWTSESAAGEKSVIVDMADTNKILGFVYTPREGDDKSGTIFHYRFLTSEDGENWTEQPTPREFSNIVNNPIEQRVFLNNPVSARFFKLVAVDEIEGRDFVTIGELSIIVPRPKQ